ncbi:MAG: HEAT repeat domain-containing protein [Promethearchaeota archaeon]
MNDTEKEAIEISQIKDFVNDGRFDDAVQIIALYIGDALESEYLDRLENVIETLLTLHGGRTVLRFLIENLIIDIPSLLENLSNRDPVLRFTFLLLLKTICEKECDLFLPYSEDLVNSEDPNVREAALQLLIYMAGGEAIIDDDTLIKTILIKLSDEKDFVAEKAIQALKTIGMKSPKLMTKILTDYAKEISEMPENEELINSIDQILKSIVTVDKIEEIVEEEIERSEVEEKEYLGKEKSEILDKEFELKKKELEIKKRKLEIEEKEKEIEEKVIQKKEEVLKLKKEILEKEGEIGEEIEKKIPKKLKKKEEEIIDKEIELKKKDLEIKKKKLELDEKEKELEEKEILEREKALKLKEELIEKEKELSLVELELKQKSIQEKEQEIKKEELKRVEKELEKIKEKEQHNDEN